MVTDPAPVMVTVPPETVAGPDTTRNDTGRPELALADRLKGASPNERSVNELKLMVCEAFDTVKLLCSGGAALKTPSPLCDACTVTVPAPVIVSVVPDSVAGPDTMLKLTGNPDEAVALRAKGASPKVRFGSVGNVMAWDCLAMLLTINDWFTTGAGWKLLFPACEASITTSPAPLIVTVLPDTEAGPLTTR